jgi:hypothetical protein
MELVMELNGYMRIGILTGTCIRPTVFWDVAPCNVVGTEGIFTGTYCLDHEGDGGDSQIH